MPANKGILNAVQVACILNATIEPQPTGTVCYTCGSELRNDGVCVYCIEHLAFLEIKKGIKTLFTEGDLVEVRAFHKDGKAIYSGVFDDRLILARAIRELELSRSFKSIYYTLNPVSPNSIDNSRLNKVSPAIKATRDSEIMLRRWLLLDFDPVRKSNTSSSNMELLNAHQTANGVREYLTSLGWAEPCLASSGNGAHLIYRLANLPNTDASTTLINGVLRELSRRFTTEAVTLDTAVGNASRITKAYGTTARKGEESSSRPWRGSHLKVVGGAGNPVTADQLQQLLPDDPDGGRIRSKPKMAEGFDIEDFCEYYDLSVLNPEGEDKEGRLFFYLDSCPFKGTPHSGDPKKSALVLGDVLGFKCFSDECDGKGIGDLLRLLNKEYELYPYPLFLDIPVGGEGEDVEWPAAKGVPTPTEETPEPVLLVPVTPVEESMTITITTVKDKECDWDELATYADPLPPLIIPLEPYVSEFQPDLCTIPIPANAMYGWIAEKVLTLDAPLGWAYPAMLTAFAAQGVNMQNKSKWDGVRPTLYTCLLGKVSDGKSITQDRAVASFPLLDSSVVNRTTPGSDRGLVKMFSPPKPKRGEETFAPELKSVLLVQDEFKHLLSKIAIENSGLAMTLCTLFYIDTASNADRTGVDEALVRLNILGALKCDDEEEFTRAFGVGSTGGLYDRFLFGLGQQGWNWNFKWRPTLLHRTPIDVVLSEGAYLVLKKWREQKTTDAEGNTTPIHKGRLSELAERVAIISSSANRESAVSVECMETALRFAEWQERIRAVYCPGDAQSKDGECTAALLRKCDKFRDTDGMPLWFSWNKMYKNTSWNKTYGPDLVKRMRGGLVAMGSLEEEKTNPDPDDSKKRDKKGDKTTGRYRVVD